MSRVRVSHVIATVGGVGYLSVGPGTAGSAVGLLIGWLTSTLVPRTASAQLWLWLALLVGFVIAAIAATKTERELRVHDPSFVVVDELWGMWAIAVAVPIFHDPLLTALGFALFRLFDITKPPPLKLLARWPAGWGIMFDDAGAAVYSIGILWLVAKWLSG